MALTGRKRKLGVTDKQLPLSVKIHEEITDWVKSKPNTSQWLREVIISAAWEEVGGRKVIMQSVKKEPSVWAYIGESHRLPPALVDLIVTETVSVKKASRGDKHPVCLV